MRSTIINKAGNWSSIWTDKMKEALKSQQDNQQVGQNLILETTTFKVWSIHLPMGESLPFHRHNKPYFYTTKTKGKSRSFYSDGIVIDTEYNANDIKYFHNLSKENFFIHNLVNIGNSTLIFTTVEFKKHEI